jgi:hypothetical protein
MTFDGVARMSAIGEFIPAENDVVAEARIGTLSQTVQAKEESDCYICHTLIHRSDWMVRVGIRGLRRHLSGECPRDS